MDMVNFKKAFRLYITNNFVLVQSDLRIQYRAIQIQNSHYTVMDYNCDTEYR